jgi:hypothetical protein
LEETREGRNKPRALYRRQGHESGRISSRAKVQLTGICLLVWKMFPFDFILPTIIHLGNYTGGNLKRICQYHAFSLVGSKRDIFPTNTAAKLAFLPSH